MNLQLFADSGTSQVPEEPKVAIQGKKIAYLYRLLSERSTNSGTKVAFTTEDSVSYSSDAESTQTKDGVIRTPGSPEVEINSTALLLKGDEMIKKMRDALINGDLFEIWEVNLEEPVPSQTNKFYGRYFQGYVTSFEKTSSAEDFVECSLTFGVNGSGVDGEVTVTQDQQDMIEQYGFIDSTQVTSSPN